ncbi:protein transport protein BET1 [Lactarius akahatsu]|uniref:Protein transport protein BET1 n=1 Tax=Lactarius akahatsu TaxID=416441 RepID=A0AAD4QE02_9AGAM|nr:protein transport protein BET1 [Lactarius akahatsu]
MTQRHRVSRAALGLDTYAPTPPHSGRSSPYPGYHHPSSSDGTPFGGTRFADDLEGQNDEAIEGLGAKVKLLKEITIGIGNEVRESTVQLSQMNNAFAETSGILAGTFRRMNNMADRQGCRWLWYITFLISVFCFFIIVWWFRR